MPFSISCDFNFLTMVLTTLLDVHNHRAAATAAKTPRRTLLDTRNAAMGTTASTVLLDSKNKKPKSPIGGGVGIVGLGGGSTALPTFTTVLELKDFMKDNDEKISDADARAIIKTLNSVPVDFDKKYNAFASETDANVKGWSPGDKSKRIAELMDVTVGVNDKKKNIILAIDASYKDITDRLTKSRNISEETRLKLALIKSAIDVKSHPDVEEEFRKYFESKGAITKKYKFHQNIWDLKSANLQLSDLWGVANKQSKAEVRTHIRTTYPNLAHAETVLGMIKTKNSKKQWTVTLEVEDCGTDITLTNNIILSGSHSTHAILDSLASKNINYTSSDAINLIDATAASDDPPDWGVFLDALSAPAATPPPPAGKPPAPVIPGAKTAVNLQEAYEAKNFDAKEFLALLLPDDKQWEPFLRELPASDKRDALYLTIGADDPRWEIVYEQFSESLLDPQEALFDKLQKIADGVTQDEIKVNSNLRGDDTKRAVKTALKELNNQDQFEIVIRDPATKPRFKIPSTDEEKELSTDDDKILFVTVSTDDTTWHKNRRDKDDYTPTISVLDLHAVFRRLNQNRVTSNTTSAEVVADIVTSNTTTKGVFKNFSNIFFPK